MASELFAVKKKKHKSYGIVVNTAEFRRVYDIPRRVLNLDDVFDVTPLFRIPGKSGGFKLRPIQSAALIEAAENNGLLCPAGVGAGKTLICLLLPYAMDAKRAIILTRPRLKHAMLRDAKKFYGRHLKIPWKRFQVVSYNELSSAKGADILDRNLPDLIICDEAHDLRHSESARTKRFMRYAKHHPECRFVFLSGTFTSRSPRDFAHLAELALRKNSPLPLYHKELVTWCGALEVDPQFPTEPGVLKQFCRKGESVRKGFFRRMNETFGVVGDASASQVSATLIIEKRDLRVPENVLDILERVEKDWKIGDKEMNLALEKSLAVQQLASGFYYQWVWPNGKPDREWLEARANYFAEVRKKLKRSQAGMDSPFLLEQAAKRGHWESIYYERWAEIRDRVKPKTETIWVDDFLIDASIKWAHKHRDKGAILWYVFSAVGEKLARKGKFPLYGAGREAELAREPVIVCSIRAQGTGQNLQHRYSRNLFTALRPNGLIFEQTVGRTHRTGQKEDEVLVSWWGHTEDALDAMEQIKLDCEYQQNLTGPQKVLYGTHIQQGGNHEIKISPTRRRR